MLKQEIIALFRNNPNFVVFEDHFQSVNVRSKFKHIEHELIAAYREVKKGFITVSQHLFTPNGFYANPDRFVTFVDLISIKQDGKKYRFYYPNNEYALTLDEITGTYVCKAFDIYKKYRDLSHKYLNGIDVEKNIEKGIDYLIETISYTNLRRHENRCKGIDYYNAKDYIKAVAYLKCGLNLKLSFSCDEYKKKDALSFHYLGNCYYYGYGVEKNMKKANYYYYQAYYYDEDITDAIYNYALTCKEIGEPEKMWNKIRRYSSPRFASLIGECYYHGWGTLRDINKAKKYLLASCQEISSAYYYLALIERDQKNYVEYFQYLNKAIHGGYLFAYNQLGIAHHEGLGTNVNYKVAFDCYNKMIELYPDDSDAYYNLGLLYYHGLGVSKDYMKVFNLWDLSYTKGYKDCVIDLARLLIEGDDSVRDVEKGMSYLDKEIKEFNIETILYKAKLYIEGLFVEKDINLAYEMLLQRIPKEKTSTIIADEFIEYLSYGMFGSEYNIALRAFKDVTELYQNNQSLKRHYEEAKDYYCYVFKKHYNINKKDVVVENGIIKARYIYKENDYSYFVDENGNLIKTYPFVALQPDVIEGDELVLTLVEGDVLFINTLKNQSINAKLIRLLSGKTVEQIIELTSHAPHNEPQNAIEIFKMLVKKDRIEGFYELGKLFYKHKFENAALKMNQKVITYPFTEKNAFYIMNAKCGEMDYVDHTKVFCPGRMKQAYVKEVFDFIDKTMIQEESNPLFKAYKAVKEDLSVENIVALKNEFNQKNIKYHLECYGLFGFRSILSCVEAMLRKKEANQGYKEHYMWLKGYYLRYDYDAARKWGQMALEAGIPSALRESVHNPEFYDVEYDGLEASSILKQAARMGDSTAKMEIELKKDTYDYYKKRYISTLENEDLNEKEKRELLNKIEENITYTTFGTSLTFSKAQEEGYITYDKLASIETVTDFFLKKDKK